MLAGRCGFPRNAALVEELHAGKYVATSFGLGISEDGFLFELDTALLSEWNFTPELLQETMTIVHERAKLRLHDKITHGAVTMSGAGAGRISNQ